MAGAEAARILKASAWTQKAKSNFSGGPTLATNREWWDASNGTGPDPVNGTGMIPESIPGQFEGTPPKVALRWESSSAVRQALKAPIGTDSTARFGGYYVISASGYGPSGRSGFNIPASATQMYQNPAAATLTVKSKTKGQTKLQATRVELARIDGHRLLLFFFPRDREITADDAEVVFESTTSQTSRNGSKSRLTVKAKFRPAEMCYGGALGL
jgi:hypothetical protein